MIWGVFYSSVTALCATYSLREIEFIYSISGAFVFWLIEFRGDHQLVVLLQFVEQGEEKGHGQEAEEEAAEEH